MMNKCGYLTFVSLAFCMSLLWETALSEGTNTEDTVHAGVDAIRLWNDAEIIEDSSARDGKSVRMNNEGTGWNIQWRWTNTSFLPRTKYTLFTHVKIKKENNEGNAMEIGIWDEKEKRHLLLLTIPVKDIEDMEWKTIKVGDFLPSQDQYAYVAKANNPLNASWVYVDYFYLVPDEGWVKQREIGTLVDDFSGDIGQKWKSWRSLNETTCSVTTDTELIGDKTYSLMKLDYHFPNGIGETSVHYSFKQPVNLLKYEKFTFWVKGPVKGNLLLHIRFYDKSGKELMYGTHSGNQVFHFGYKMWAHLSIDFNKDRSYGREKSGLPPQEEFDYTRVNAMDIYLNAFQADVVPNPGTVWIDDIYLIPLSGISVTPNPFSPNDDGINDLTIIRFPASTRTEELIIRDTHGRIMKTFQVPAGANQIEWDGVDKEGKKTADGNYQFIFAGQSCEIKIDTTLYFKKSTNILKEFFPIGVWYAHGENLSEYYDKTFKQLSDCGVNTIFAPHSQDTLILEMASKYGLKVIIRGIWDSNFDEGKACQKVKEYTTKFCDYQSLLGYYIIDEPQIEDAPILRFYKRVFEEVDPKHPVFSCFVGLDRIKVNANVMHPHILLLDVYTLKKNSAPGDFSDMYGQGSFTGYLANARRLANIPDSSLWVIVQAHSYRDELRSPLPEEIRAQVWMALLQGAKGIIYFMYQSVPTVGITHGLVDENLTPTPNLVEAKRLSLELNKIAPILLEAKMTENVVTTSVNNIEFNSFENKQGNKYLIIVNKNVISSSSVELILDRNAGNVSRVIDLLSKGKVNFTEGKITCQLRPGDGTLLEIQ